MRARNRLTCRQERGYYCHLHAGLLEVVHIAV
jgi:hypothetical protein